MAQVEISWSDPGANTSPLSRDNSEDTSIDTIIMEVASKYGISRTELISDRRTRYLAWPRQEVMYRASKETRLSLPAIGRHLGGRDHSTVHHGIRQHQERMKGNQP